MATPGDGRVVIKIDIDFDDSGLAAAKAKIKMLANDSSRASGRLKELSGSLDDVDKSSQSTSRSLDKVGKSKKSLTSDSDRLGRRLRKTAKEFDITKKAVGALGKILSTTLKFGLIAAAIEFAAVGLALSTVNGLLAIGSASVKVYRWTLAGLSYAAAAGTAALATLAAAQREYNAALFDYRYKSMPQFGSGTNQAMTAMRMLTSDAELASFGLEALNSTFAAVSKNAEFSAPMKDALKGVADFAVAAGGDIGKNLTAAGNFIGLLQKEGKITDEILGAASQVSEEFQKTVENAQKMGVTSAEELMKGLSSGILSEAAGFAGALDAVNNTLFGQAKGFFTETVSMFADLGQLFLPETKRAFDQIENIFRANFMRISADLVGFADGRFLQDLVKVTDRLATVFSDLIGKYLPQSEGMFGGIDTAIDVTIRWFNKFEQTLKRLSPAAKVLTDAFGPALKQLFWDGIKDSINSLATFLESNQDKMQQFGEGLSNAITGVQSAFTAFKNFIVENLPLISNILNLFGYAAGAVATALNALAKVADMNSGLGALAAVLGIGGAAVGLSKLNQGLGRTSNGRLTGGLQRAGDAIRRRVGDSSALGAAGRGMTQMTAATVNITATTVYLNSRSTVSNAGGGKGGKDARPVYGPRKDELLPASNLAGGASTASDRAFSNRMQRAFGWAKGGGTGATIAGFGAQALLMGAANERATPFIGAGSMVGMFNPLAGLGISAGGAALTAETMGGGIAAGAASGAAFGAMIGPLGAAIGAGIGGAIGGIAGKINENNIIEERVRGLAREQVFDQGNRVGRSMLLLGPEGLEAQLAQEQNDVNRAVEAFNSIFITPMSETEEELARLNLGESGTVDKEWLKDWVEEQRIAGLASIGAITQREADAFREAIGNNDVGRDFTNQMQTDYNRMADTSRKMSSNLENNFSMLERSTGMTREEVADLAKTMGVSLSNKVYDLNEALELLGKTVPETIDELNSSLRRVASEAIVSVLQPIIERETNLEAMDQATEEVLQRGSFGTPRETAEYVMTMLQGHMSYYEDNPLQAITEFQRQFGTFESPGVAFQQGGILQNVQMTPELSAMVNEAAGTAFFEQLESWRTDISTFFGTNLDPQLSFNQEALMAMLSEIQSTEGTEKMIEVMTNLNANLLENPALITALENAKSPIDQQSIISGILLESGFKGTASGAFGPLFGFQQPDSTKTQELPEGDDYSGLRSALENGMTSALENPPPWWDGMPEPSWFSGGIAPSPELRTLLQNAGKDGGADGDPNTPMDTPTSRLASTLMRHSRYDSMLAGKRMVTSSFRTDRLGSLKSDHVTGNAYDLVGQNLVGYATMVNRTGGFAEFHGSGSDRHLHVVPGMPVGDAMAPMPAAAIMTGGGGNSTVYNISVNAAPGQNPNAIADAVMARIDARDRDMRERS